MSAQSLRVQIRHAFRGAGPFSLDVSFEAGPGITVLFGRSGSGKSTTLGCIAGIIRPQSGRISMGENVWFDSELKTGIPVHERRVGYVFQSLALFPHLTGADNTAYGIDGSLPKAERRARAVRMLERMKVGHLADRRPSSYSGGESQRVALARAFAMTPRLVLLDEPFSALDRDLRLQLMAELRAHSDELAIPVVHVTHNRSEARAIASRVVILEGGRVTAAGAVDELLPELPRSERDDLEASLRERQQPPASTH